MLRIYFVTGVAVYEISCPNTSLQAKAFVHEISCTAHALRGDGEIRTLDPLLARQVLSQLSYTPRMSGIHLSSHIVTNVVFSAGQVLTVVFGMGTGVTPDRISTKPNLRTSISAVCESPIRALRS